MADKHHDAGGALDIKPSDVQPHLTDQELKQQEGGQREDQTPPASIRAVVREGRDTLLTSVDTDPEEDNGAPGVREQP